MADEFNLIQKIAIWALPVIFAITVHEVAHGYVARMFGDDTAARQGRLTLNPISHIDPIGTLLVPAILLVLGGFMFGWAKAVPVNMARLRNPRRDMAIVAAAGPGANALMAIGWAVLLKITLGGDPEAGLWIGLRYMSMAGISINLILMVLNLLPLPPLDGGRVAMGLLPRRAADALGQVEPYGFVIMIALLATGMLSRILMGPFLFSQGLLFRLVGL